MDKYDKKEEKCQNTLKVLKVGKVTQSFILTGKVGFCLPRFLLLCSFIILHPMVSHTSVSLEDSLSRLSHVGLSSAAALRSQIIMRWLDFSCRIESQLSCFNFCPTIQTNTPLTSGRNTARISLQSGDLGLNNMQSRVSEMMTCRSCA